MLRDAPFGRSSGVRQSHPRTPAYIRAGVGSVARPCISETSAPTRVWITGAS